MNAVAPGAFTRMTVGLGLSDEVAAQLHPERIAPLIRWLASTDSADVTGQVIECSGQILGIAEGWHGGPHIDEPRTDPLAVGEMVRQLLTMARPPTRMVDAT